MLCLIPIFFDGYSEIKVKNKIRGSHNITIKAFQKFIMQNKTKYKIKNYDVMKIFNIGKMKTARHKSDYQKSNITEKEYQYNQKWCAELLAIFDKIFK